MKLKGDMNLNKPNKFVLNLCLKSLLNRYNLEPIIIHSLI